MSTIIFKRLFEVRVLHDYFLTSVDGSSFFDKTEIEKDDEISKKLTNKIYDVQDLFSIEPVGDTIKRMSEYKLKIAKTALGFFIGTEVKVENRAGETLYKPRFEIGTDVNLTFSIKPTVPLFTSITNISLRPPLPSIYYLTNKGKDKFEDPVDPTHIALPISNKTSSPQEGKTYEMGAVLDFAGTIREARQYTDGTDPNHWDDVAEKRFVNDADRVLLPHVFAYKFKSSQNVTEVDFVLENESNAVIKTISKVGTEVLETIRLDFTKVDDNDPDSDAIPAGMYMLKVKTNVFPEITYQLYLNDVLYNRNHLAIIDIRFDEKEEPYSLLDAENFLKTRIDAADQKISHPVYEVRFKNRKTYWRYNNEGGFSEDDVDATSAFLKPDPIIDPKKLVSENPKGLTETLVPFINGGTLVLPHPRMPAIKIEKERIFSEIFINKSNRLLNN